LAFDAAVLTAWSARVVPVTVVPVIAECYGGLGEFTKAIEVKAVQDTLPG
jgi:hypothetical protein